MPSRVTFSRKSFFLEKPGANPVVTLGPGVIPSGLDLKSPMRRKICRMTCIHA